MFDRLVTVQQLGGRPGRSEMFGGKVTWFFGEEGAHVRVPGFMYNRHTGPTGWSTGRSWQLLGLICLRHNNDNNGKLHHCKPAGWSVTTFTIDWAQIKRAFRKADWYVS